MSENNELMDIGGAVALLRQGKRVARLGWTLDGKCWELRPEQTADGPYGGIVTAETILMRYSDGTWGPPEYSVRSLLAQDWFEGMSGDRERPY
ncbi:hypothetical protein [Streptomyces sp. NPDC088727]|uniref:Thoeris anti-defense Tad2 family protein n=1 Tax=Streptomyces sp. NPDC088727 TaxID=3365875 RepID=UPI003826E29D